jgi:hypothetical protein
MHERKEMSLFFLSLRKTSAGIEKKKTQWVEAFVFLSLCGDGVV